MGSSDLNTHHSSAFTKPSSHLRKSRNVTCCAKALADGAGRSRTGIWAGVRSAASPAGGRGASHRRLRAGSDLESVIVGVTRRGQARPPAPAVRRVLRQWCPWGLLRCCPRDQETSRGAGRDVRRDPTPLLAPVARASPSAGLSRLAPARDEELPDSPVWFSLPPYVPPPGSVPGGRRAAPAG